MRSLRYLNGILTVIAVLLTLNLWAQWNAGPHGQESWVSQSAQAQAIDPGSQRREMIDQLKLIAAKLDQTQNLLASGNLKVKVEGLDGGRKD